MPKAVKDSARPVIEREQLEELLSNVTDLRDWCILGIAIFGELRSEELFALTWPVVGADYVDIENSCWHGVFRPGKLKNDASKRRVFLPETIIGGLALWREACPESEHNLLFRGGVGCMWPGVWWQKRIHPIARRLGMTVMPTCQVLRRSGMTRLQHMGSEKDRQAHAGHIEGSKVTNRVYTQAVEAGLRAMVAKDADGFRITLPAMARKPEGASSEKL